MDTHEICEETVGCLHNEDAKNGIQCFLEENTTNADLYQELPKVALKIQQRRMRLAGHFTRHANEIANKLVLWQPMKGRTSRGRRQITYADVLLEDTGMERVKQLKTIMEDREEWRKRVDAVVGCLDR